MDEFLLCPAIHYDDGRKHYHTPRNIVAGQVFGGCSLEASLEIITQLLDENIPRTPGFLTSKGFFVEDKGKLSFPSFPDEHILCAAIQKSFDGLRYNPVNAEGVVLAGWRHHNSIGQAISLKLAAPGNPVLTSEQGFITSNNRYVSREEGLIIAKRNNQIMKKHSPHYELHSEDLY